MFSRSKKPTVKKSAIVEETPLFAQLLPTMAAIIKTNATIAKRALTSFMS